MRYLLYIFSILVCAQPAWADGDLDPTSVEPPDSAGDGPAEHTTSGEVIEVRPVDTRADHPADLISPESRHRDAEQTLASEGFRTVIRVGDHAGETLPLAEAVADSAGAQVRSLGGLGSFSSLSIRGAPSGHSQVWVDGVPLTTLGSATVDLGRFELGSFSTVTVHRSGAPLLFGATRASALELESAIGTPMHGRQLALSAGVGSFGARHLRARHLGGVQSGGAGYHAAVGYAGADGDFDYFDDNGTNLNPDDDRTALRQNNGYQQIDGNLRGQFDNPSVTLSAGSRSLWRKQGVPGRDTRQSMNTSLTTWSQLVDVSMIKRAIGDRPLAVVRSTAFAMVELQRYRDVDGEIGLASQDRRYTTWTTGLGITGSDEVGGHVLTGVLDGRVDRYRDTDLVEGADMPRVDGSRAELGAAAATRFRLHRRGGYAAVIAEPAVRIDVLHTRPVIDRSAVDTGAEPEPRTELFASPRVGLLWRPSESWSGKLNVGRFVRPPTASELYGDRGFLVGNPGLRAESGERADIGVAFAPPGRIDFVDRILVESSLFASRSRDTIAMVPTAALVAGMQNLGGAWITGSELVASARLGRTVTATANYTLLHSRQFDTLASYQGRELPQRPRHQLYGRIDAATLILERLVAAWVDATVVSSNYLDPGNVERVPRRLLFGAGIKTEVLSSLFVTVEGKNLTDHRVEYLALDPPPRPDLTSAPQAVADFLGYPLPGRAFYLTMHWEH